MTKQISYIVTHIDPYLSKQPKDLEDKIFDALGVWYAENSEDLWCKVEKHLHPYKIKSFEYDNNRPHALTAFM
tara:strand:+ start:229 stop:447 length:219 start_codon:yes stop_codon:yes gene_type:complete